jgi:hypothetical protein
LDDDYDVWFGDASGQGIGRILRAPQSPPDRPWFRMISARVPQQPTERGYTATRERAMTAFHLAWDTVPTDDAEALVAWGKRNIQGE